VVHVLIAEVRCDIKRTAPLDESEDSGLELSEPLVHMYPLEFSWTFPDSDMQDACESGDISLLCSSLQDISEDGPGC